MNFDQGFIFLGKLSRGLFFEAWVEAMFIQRDSHCLLGTWEHYQPGTVLNQISSQSILHHRGSLQSHAMTTSWLVFLVGACSASFAYRAGLWEGMSNPVALLPLICQGWHNKHQRLGVLNSGSSSLIVLEARSLILRHHRVGETESLPGLPTSFQWFAGHLWPSWLVDTPPWSLPSPSYDSSPLCAHVCVQISPFVRTLVILE